MDGAATARDGYGYEPFDCARAVALIGFLGLLSNWQDIVDEVTGVTRRRRSTGHPSPPHTPWDVLQRVMDAVSGEEPPLQDSPKAEDNEVSPGMLKDLATLGPKLALWLVDVGDGRVGGAEGRDAVCRSTKAFTDTHGWLGSQVSSLLTDTLAGALGVHHGSRTLLKDAGLNPGLVCP